MIAKVIVDIPSKSVDFKFDYIVPQRLEDGIQIGVRVIVPFGPRTIQGYVMDIQNEPDQGVEISKLKEIKEVQDIQPELTAELIKLSEWMSHYHVTKRISVLEAMLPSAIKAKYSKAFEVIKGSDISESILKKFNKDGRYLYKDAQQNDDLNDMFTLMKENLVQEVTILSQNIKKKTQRAVAVIEDYNGDDVLSLLEKYAKQYDLYAFY